jgi:hypothetical protein
VQGRYADLKQAAANRSPRELGTIVKGSEVQFHHEVYNQSLWNQLPEPTSHQTPVRDNVPIKSTPSRRAGPNSESIQPRRREYDAESD